MKKISIKDIAIKAGVVPSTVSFVINGKDKEMRISQALTDKIKAIIEETGYYPNHTAVSLRTGKTNIIGLIVEDISNVFFSTLAKTIEDEAYKAGYKIVYCSTENNDLKGIELIKMLSRQQVDGFLITPSAGMVKEIKKLLVQNKPVVLMDRYFPELDIHYTIVDNYAGVKEGMEHLVSKGYKNIAFVTVDIGLIQMQQREMGYRQVLEKHHLTPAYDSVLKLSYSLKEEESIEKIKTFIKSYPQIDAIFFATNYLGIYGLQGLRQLKLSIPGDVAVICFDDHDIFKFYTPSITVVSQPIKEIAKTAVRLLVSQLENNGDTLTGETKFYINPPILIEREST